MDKVSTWLWCNRDAEAMAAFYTGLIPDSRIVEVVRSPADYPNGKAGDVLTVEFTLAGRSFCALNGGPEFTFSEAISLQISCEDQAEVDRYWHALSAHPGNEQCGWVKDRYGLSWQIVPRRLTQLIADRDRARSKRVMEAMMSMKKIDLAELERAAQG
ncbi:3-demethylubiquinone-9 3-methyltransferase [Lysobacter concretionis Ko07 = DSM 16239]|uniref:3-demethylubiquinone-9 3-methyltransferase n=1 Tax=Lysobacter concretionis Ko07 = DSM 16239 TaxID=1122185 RepID=A0A0A0EJG3_9GAMM|nr:MULTISPECIES: VOC family protein [Lysobacter]KGM51126.1 3-demethylubiquinone-9 3-methyltransferase [Lysobacter concretionis Ko07 = DSM 16239]QOD90889.1 VOC family protein [Lysobacter sp. CW239]